MSSLRNVILGICWLQLTCVSAWAEAKVSISAQPNNDASSVIITFEQDDVDSIQACHYNLFAAKKSRDLSTLPGKGLSIATFKRDLPLVQIIAAPLRSLKRSNFGLLQKSSVKIYLRTLISCSDSNSSLGRTISFSVPTHRKGKLTSIKGYLRDLKFHMKYFTP